MQHFSLPILVPFNKLLRYLTVILFLVSIAYVAKGSYHLVLAPGLGVPGDLHLRWQEQQYVFRNINPYEVADRWELRGSSVGSNLEREVGIEPDLGVPSPGYPPWAYATGAVFIWPSNWSAARWYFAAINWCLLIPVGIWAYHLGQPGGNVIAIFFCVATLAMGSVCHTLGNGQYGIIVLVSLLGALWSDGRYHPIVSGLLMGIALVKPTLSLPFLVPMLFKQRYVSLLTAAIYIGLASCFTWWLTYTDPVTMLNQMVMASSRWGIQDGSDPIAFLCRAGIGRSTAAKAVAAVVVTLAFALFYFYRQASMLTLFGIAALAARLWTYHRQYDDLILAFLMLALGSLAIERSSRRAMAACVVMGFTLWLPARVIEEPAVQLFMMLVWIICLAALLSALRTPLAAAGHRVAAA